MGSVLGAAHTAQEEMKAGRWQYREKIDGIVYGLSKYVGIVDIAVSAKPEFTALVWASARFLLQVLLPFNLGVICTNCRKYKALLHS